MAAVDGPELDPVHLWLPYLVAMETVTVATRDSPKLPIWLSFTGGPTVARVNIAATSSLEGHL